MFESAKSKNERQKSIMQRVIFEATVKYKPLDDNVRLGPCRDLSVGGLFLKTRVPYDIDQTVTLTFSIPTQNKEIPISCKARVAWTNFSENRLKADYPPGVGLQFLDLSKEDLVALSKFIDKYEDAKKMNVLCAWCGSDLGLRKGPFGKTSHGICNKCLESLN